MLNNACQEKERQLSKIFKELQYHKLELVHKYGLNHFYMKNKEGSKVCLLRSFHDSDFDPDSQYFSNAENKINKIKSDYNYVLNIRLDC